jgi:hypothetical protein
MPKLFIKPIWIVTIVLLGAWVIALKLALAIPAFVPANQPIGYVAQDDVTNYNLTSGHEILYRAQYEREYWGGNLIAYGVNSAGDIATATQPWNGGAANQLDIQGANRRIVTLKSDGSQIPFTWASLSTVQQGNLTSSAVLDYLRGDHSGEVQQGGILRQRASALGDIVHSRPYYLSDSASTTPAPTVFVGANDGMLHAFDAATGAERWAYVPSMLIPKMSALSIDPGVSTNFPHDYYVDGSVNVATILSGSKRVLVGALGAGGKGLFALDITGSARLTPADEASAATNILWEITPTTLNNAANSTYSNLGYTYANPTIAKVSGVDAVIVGNGYNNGGNYQAYLYLINANTGALISAIQAGTSGTSGSPNGLSTPVAIDSNNDGNVDTVYAGDLNGTMWKFDLSAASATALLTTSPAQPITMTPGVARHPNGGYMINFATGAMLAAADLTDTSTFAAYGIWDGAPTANTALLSQTLTERCYTAGVTAAATPCASRVRTVTSNQPDWTTWTTGAAHNKGWRVALPTSEKVVGDGSYIENGRFYFTSYNPTVSTTVQTSTVKGENWLMELDYLSGGVSNLPFLDLSGNHVLTDDDRVKDSVSPPAPVMTTDGIPVGKLIGIGVMSQPILVQLSTLNNTLFNQNPDVAFSPVALGTQTGVTGGHFDVDYFYVSPTGGAQASATITVGTTGQSSGYPATLGAITVNGVTIVPALTVTDITDGTASSTNTSTINSKVTGGFTATKSGNVITIKAPTGTQFNGKAISIAAGTSQTLVPAVASVTAVAGVTGVAPTAGTLVITAVDQNKTVSIKCGSTYVGSSASFTSSNSNTASTRLNALYTTVNGTTVNGYTTSCTRSPNTSSPTSLTCSISAPVGVSHCPGNGGFTVDSNINDTTNTGPAGGVNAVTAVAGVTAVAQSGWTNFAPALTAAAFNNSGAEAASVGDTCVDTTCKYDIHFHQYDKVFDVTGVNLLNPSSTTINIKNSIPSLLQNFKVLVQNQYLSPAVKLHIGDPTYLYNVDYGYIALKDYATSATLDLATLQTYRRDPNAVWPGSASTDAQKLAQPKPIGSFTFNMPIDALSAKNWWGNGDVRAGLHPTVYSCVWQAVGTHDGNMYQPVIPPANGVDGPGVAGWSSSTTPTTATGARHNGALVIQIIRDSTPNSAIEQNVAGRPEYGWRIRSGLYSNYVLAEYATYWHHPNGKCYNSSGWTKTPPADNGTTTPVSKAAGSTDPKIGNLAGSVGGAGGTITSVVTTVSGAVSTTTITYSDGTSATIVRTANADGTVTIVTTDALKVVTTETIANTDGSLKTGGDERARQAARTGRISWRELVAP